jgi:RNA polymerase sigma factor (sigma-70 family)
VTIPFPSDRAQDQDDLLDLVRRAQAGSAEAARALFERCREPLLAVIRKYLHPPLRKLYDSDDFLMETFVVIFTRHFSDEVLNSPESLWPYLNKIAENKVRDAERKHLNGHRRDLTREVSLEEIIREPWSKELSPADALLLKELVEDRLEDLVNQVPPLLGAILKHLIQGNNSAEIAHGLHLEPKRVYRAMEWLRRKIIEN